MRLILSCLIAGRSLLCRIWVADLDYVEKKEREIAVREMGRGWYSDEGMKNEWVRHCQMSVDAHTKSCCFNCENFPPSGDALSASNHEPTLFFFLHHAFHMWCRALKKTATPAVKFMMVVEKKASEEYNLVPVLFGRHTWTPTTLLSDLRSLFLCKKKSTSRLPGRASNNTCPWRAPGDPK